MKAKTIEELRKEFCEIYKLEYIPLMSNILFQYVQHLEQKLIQPEPQKGSDVALIINELEKRIDYLKNNVTEHNIVRQVDLESILNFAHSLPLVSEPKQVTKGDKPI